MANIIKIKRGLEANLPSLAIGEIAYTTNTNKLFIGVNTGTVEEPVIQNVLVSNLNDLANYYTKTQIEALGGLGLVWNAETSKFDADLATQGEAEAGTDNTVLMTPLRTKEAIDAQTGTILTSADYVAFSDLAAQQDAEDGTLNDVWMSPLRTAQAIAELAPTPVIATQEEAEAGSINNKFMTPLRTAEAIAELAPTPVIATQEEAEAGSINNKFMTPLRTAEAIAELAGGASVQNYTLTVNASDTWARDQITVVETEDYVQSESSEHPLSATVDGGYYLETNGPQAGSARYSTFDGVSLESRAGVSSGFWDGSTRVQAFLNDVLVLDGVKFENFEIIQESMGGVIVIDTNLSILAPTDSITYNKLVVFIDSEEGVSGDGIHAVNDATHIYRYGVQSAASTTYDLPINSTQLNTPSTPVIFTFNIVDGNNNRVIFLSNPSITQVDDSWLDFGFGEIIYIQFANLPQASNVPSSYNIQFGLETSGKDGDVEVIFGTMYGNVVPSDRFTVLDLVNAGLWTEDVPIAIQLSADNGGGGQAELYTFYKDRENKNDLMTLVSNIEVAVLQKINKETFVQEQEVISPAENLYEVFNITIDSTHVYILTGDIDDVYEVQKYLKSDLSFVAKEPLADLKLAVAQDDDYLYIGGVESGAYVPDGVGFYDKETLEKVLDTSAYGSVIESVFVDDQYLYAAGGDYEVFEHPVQVWDKTKDEEGNFKSLAPSILNIAGFPNNLFTPTGVAIGTEYAAITAAPPFEQGRIWILKNNNGAFSLETSIEVVDTEVFASFYTLDISANESYLVASLFNAEVGLQAFDIKNNFAPISFDIVPASISMRTALVSENNNESYVVARGDSNDMLIYKLINGVYTKLVFANEEDGWAGFRLFDLTPNGQFLVTSGNSETLAGSFLQVFENNGSNFVLTHTITQTSRNQPLISPDGVYIIADSNLYKKVNGEYVIIENAFGENTIPLFDNSISFNYANNTEYLSYDGVLLVYPTDFPNPSETVTILKQRGDTFEKIEFEEPNPRSVRYLALSVDRKYLMLSTLGGGGVLRIYELNSEPLLIGNTVNYEGIIKSVIADDSFIYAAGEQDPIADSIIVKYSKDTLEIVGTSIAVGGAVDKLEQDGDFIYALSIDAEAIKQYAKSDLSLISTLTIDNMQSFTQDTDFIYSFEALLGELSKSTKGSLSYNLTKAVSGITAEDDPIVDIDLSTNKFSDVVPIQEAWGLVYRLDTLEDEVKLYATEEPEFPANTTVKLKVVK